MANQLSCKQNFQLMSISSASNLYFCCHSNIFCCCVKDSIPLVRDHSEDIHQLQDMENSPGNIHCDLEVVHVQIKFSKVKVKVVYTLHLACILNSCGNVWSIFCLGFPTFRLLAELHFSSSLCCLFVISSLCNIIFTVKHSKHTFTCTLCYEEVEFIFNVTAEFILS